MSTLCQLRTHDGERLETGKASVLHAYNIVAMPKPTLKMRSRGSSGHHEYLPSHITLVAADSAHLRTQPRWCGANSRHYCVWMCDAVYLEV